MVQNSQISNEKSEWNYKPITTKKWHKLLCFCFWRLFDLCNIRNIAYVTQKSEFNITSQTYIFQIDFIK